MAAEETKIIRLVIDSSKAVEGGREAQRALEAIERQTRQSADALSRMESGFDVAAMVAKVAAAAYVVKEFAERMFGIYKAARDAASAVTDFAQQLGVSTDFVQGSMHAATEQTVSIDKLGAAYTKATQTIGQAAQGQKDAVELFDRLGVKILDTTGKLRPTEDILANSAAALLKIEDPAKRVAAAMEVFGKAGVQIIPMLDAIASGSDAMANRARRAGAVIDQDVLQSMAKLKSQSEEAGLKWNALVATIGAPIATWAMEAVNKILADILANLDRLKRERAEATAGVTAARADQQNWQDQLDAALQRQRNFQPGSTGWKMEESSIVGLRNRIAQINDAKTNARQILMEGEEDAARRGAGNLPANLLGGTNTQGGSNPPVRGSGQSEAERYEKLKAQLDAAATAQEKMTEAAYRGDAAYRSAEIHADAYGKAIDIFGAAIKETDPRVEELEKRMRRFAENKAATAFAQGTVEIRNQNEVLQKQIELFGESADVIAQELAMIKARQQAAKDGIKDDVAAIEARRQSIEQNETLKAQAEQIKQANDLWLEPWRQGLRSIQTAAADAYGRMLDGAVDVGQGMVDVMKATAKRIAAELLALATVRPVISLAIEAIGPGGLGLIGGGTAAQLGFPVGAGAGGAAGIPGSMPQLPVGGGGGLGSLFGGGGLGSIFNSSGGGGGWLGRQIGGITNWLNSPLYSMGGNPLSSGAFGPTAPGLFNGSVSIGGALAGIGSIGMGAFNAFSGRGMGSTIGGIAQMAGGAMMMIPGLQPFGAVLSLLGGFGGLLDGGGPKIPPMPALAYANGDFRGAGTGYAYFGDSLNGGTTNQSAATEMGRNVLSVLRRAGLRPVAGQLVGGQFATGQAHMWDGQQWAGSPYTESGLWLPGGGYERLTSNDTSLSYEQAADRLMARVIEANITRGGVSGTTYALRHAMGTLHPSTVEEAQQVIDMAAAYDALGKAANPVKEAIDQLSTSLDDLTDFATRAGLSLDPITAELEKQTKRTAQDFIDSMLDPLAVQMRALEDERKSALETAEWIRDNVKDVYVDMARVAQYYTNQEAALREQFYQGAVGNLDALIKRLTYGDLANASPTTALSGARASYEANLAQARAGVSTAITGYTGLAEQLLQVGRSNFASGPEYEALRQQILRDAAEVHGVAGGGTTAAGGGAPAAANANAQTNAVVAQQLANSAADREESSQLRAEVSQLTAQVRILTQQMLRIVADRR